MMQYSNIWIIYDSKCSPTKGDILWGPADTFILILRDKHPSETNLTFYLSSLHFSLYVTKYVVSNQIITLCKKKSVRFIKEAQLFFLTKVITVLEFQRYSWLLFFWHGGILLKEVLCLINGVSWMQGRLFLR